MKRWLLASVAVTFVLASVAWAFNFRTTTVYDFVNGFKIGGTQVSVTAAEINKLSGLKFQRVTTGSCGTAGCTVTLTWTSAFADTNYTAVCSVEDSTAGAETGLQVTKISSVAAASVGVDVANLTAGAVTGTLHCLAVHD